MSVPQAGADLPEREAFARIQLYRSANVGPATFRALLARHGSALAALDALDAQLPLPGPRARAEIADPATIRAEVAAVAALGGAYLFHDSLHYPALMAASDTAPPVVTVAGQLDLLDQPALAMIGARNASAGAVRLAHGFAASLAAQGVVIVSGLARGIDAAAHRGALAGMGTGVGQGGGTIAVIAGGLDEAYPPEHGELQNQIMSQGLVIAEMPPGTVPQGRHFPRRNRIIAALGIACCVVEAAPRSGSLLTARMAADLGREIMAVPGSPLDARSHGTNQLIRDGATLVQSAADIAEGLHAFTGAAMSGLRPLSETFGTAPTPAVNPDQAESAIPLDPSDIAAMLGHAPVAVDDLVRQSGAGTAAVQLALLDLELAGQLQRHAGGRVSLA